MRKANAVVCAFGAVLAITLGSSDARSLRPDYDGPWHLKFMTQAGPCDAAYEFDVNISNGVITEPNLVKFHGKVAPNGAVHASVTVQDKFASGSGRLSLASGRGNWSGRSGSDRCSGYWIAERG